MSDEQSHGAVIIFLEETTLEGGESIHPMKWPTIATCQYTAQEDALKFRWW